MNTIWRFYKDQNQHWKWQRLTVKHEVIAESSAAYQDYESCLADAKDKGHNFQPSQTKKTSAGPHRISAKEIGKVPCYKLTSKSPTK